MDILKIIAKQIPRDPESKGGFWVFQLPDDCEWMQGVFKYHDLYYDIGAKAGMRLSEIDARIFKALSIAATHSDLDWMEQCHRIRQVCRYWPIMRSAGHYLFNRHKENEDE